VYNGVCSAGIRLEAMDCWRCWQRFWGTVGGSFGGLINSLAFHATYSMLQAALDRKSVTI
jgi:hypothetical protein